MSGLWLHRGMVALAACVLGLIALGVPARGALGSRALETLAGWALFGVFAALVWGALVLSPGWKAARAGIADGGWPTLRQLAWIAPITVLAQIALGVGYHYELLGAVPHLAWAFASAIILMMLATFILTHAQAPGRMKASAGVLLGATGIQAVLGVAALLGHASGIDSSAWAPAVTGAHATLGALVLGSAVVLGAQILRHVEAAPSAEMVAHGRHS